jgi:replicative DNA helicase
MVSYPTPENIERVQPCSIESESAIISAIFIDGIQSLSRCLEQKVTDKFFYLPANRIIFSTLMDLASAGKPLSMDVVSEELRLKEELSLVGGYTYLVQVSQTIPTTAELKYYIDRVRSAYINRELIRSSTQVIDLAYSEKAEVEKYTSEISRLLSIRYSIDRNISIQEAAEESLGLLRRFRDGTATDEEIGYEWPWARFTSEFGELQKGQLLVVAARPNGGKSSLARQACDHLASKYGNVMIFSREMPSREMAPLFVQTRINLSWRDLRKRRMHPLDIADFEKELMKFKEEKRLHVFDREKTLSQITARASSFAQLHQVKAICIDYLQRYDPEPAKGENRDQAIGKMTGRLKDLAMDLDVPVILLCQVNRSAEKEDRPLQMSDLRESGNIEQDADRVIFLEVPKIDPLTNCPQNPEEDGTTQIYVSARQVKGRGDGRASCGLYFKLPTTTFRSAVLDRPASVKPNPDSSSKRVASPAGH